MPRFILERVTLPVSREVGGMASPSNWVDQRDVAWAALILPRFGDKLEALMQEAEAHLGLVEVMAEDDQDFLPDQL